MRQSYIDIRIIFDEEEQQYVLGCHMCEKHVAVNIKDTPAIADNTLVFIMEHLLECNKTLN